MQIDPTKYRADHLGRLVPIESIKQIDLERDALVHSLVNRAVAISDDLARLRVLAISDITAFVDLSAEKYDAKLVGKKGGLSLTSYDGQYRVTLDIDEYVTVDERINAAKALVDECLMEWASESGTELRTIVTDAFAVDQRGRINVKRLIRLTKHNIDHPKWLRAMQAINDSLVVSGTRRYVRFYRRVGETDKYQQIPLDLANATLQSTPEKATNV